MGIRKELPLLFKFRSHKAFILSVIIVAVFTDIFLYMVIVPVLPFALEERAGVPPENTQAWVSILLAAYAGGLFVCSPICGWFADQSDSRKLPFMLGLLALIGASLLLCFGTSVSILFLGRVVQGAAAGVVWSVGFAMAPDTFGIGNAGEAMGWVSFGLNMGALVGPAAGGIVFAKSGYYAVFVMTFALLALDFVLQAMVVERKPALRMLEEVKQSTRETFDHPATETDPLIPRADGVEASKLAEPHPAPILLFVQIPRFLSALWGILALSIMFTVFDSALPLYIHEIFGWKSLGAGLLFLCASASSFFEPLFGRLADRYGTRLLAMPAFIFATPCWMFLRLVVFDSAEQKALLMMLLVGLGVCFSMGVCSLNAEISKIIDDLEKERPGILGPRGAMAQAFGLMNVAFAAGSIIGPIWGGFVKERIGWGNMTTTVGLFSAVSVIPTFIWCGSSLAQTKRQISAGDHAEDSHEQI